MLESNIFQTFITSLFFSRKQSMTYYLFFWEIAGCTSLTAADFSHQEVGPQQPPPFSAPSLRHLDLSDCAGVSDALLAALASAAPNLQNLFLRRCARITGKLSPNHQRWHAKWKLSRSEYAHVAHTFFCTLGADLYAQSVLINKISASELSRKLIKSALLVGRVQGNRVRIQ